MDQEVSTDPPVHLANAGPVGAQKDPDSDEWCTSEEDADLLGEYDLDPCSNGRSHVRAALRLGKEWGHDGLAIEWTNALAAAEFATRARRPFRIFVNPPYSDVTPWVERAIGAAMAGAAVDMLLKFDPTTRWFARLMNCDVFADVWGYKKRRKFERPGKPRLTANFPSVLVCLNSPLPEALLEHVWDFGSNGAPRLSVTM